MRREVRMGIMYHKDRRGFVYGWNHGHLMGWPNWTRKFIVNVVNAIQCARYGHNRELDGIVRDPEDGSFPCTMCRARLKPAPEYAEQGRVAPPCACYPNGNPGQCPAPGCSPLMVTEVYDDPTVCACGREASEATGIEALDHEPTCEIFSDLRGRLLPGDSCPCDPYALMHEPTCPILAPEPKR